MADCSDVEIALVGALTAVLFPQGMASPSAIGRGVRIYRGWPVTSALEADRAAGIVNLSVFPVAGSSRNTTRWGLQVSTPPGVPSLSVTVAGNSASFGGDAAAGQLAGVLIGEKAYVHRTGIGETPALVAAELADAIRADQTCWLVGSTVTVPGVSSIVGRTTADVRAITETQRQSQSFRISVWSPTPALRDMVGGLVCGALSQIRFLALPDGTGGRLNFRSGGSFDNDRDASVYRRDLVYEAEYPTTVLTQLPSMLFGDLVSGGVQLLV